MPLLSLFQINYIKMKQLITIIALSLTTCIAYAQSSVDKYALLKSNNEKTTDTKIRKTFKNFETDLIMIAESTSKWNKKYAQKITHDIIEFAESKYLKSVHVTLLSIDDTPIRAVKYIVSLKSKTTKRDRARHIKWPSIEDSSLAVVLNYNLSWDRLTREQKKEFMKNHNFKIGWISSNIDTSYSHLIKESAQTYGINDYKLSKTNFN